MSDDYEPSDWEPPGMERYVLFAFVVVLVLAAIGCAWFIRLG